jgi:hypothetical protein
MAYLGHLVRISGLTSQPVEYPLIQVLVEIKLLPEHQVGLGVQLFTLAGEDGQDVVWLDEEVMGYRWVTVRCNAIDVNGTLVSVSRPQHDINMDFGVGVLQKVIWEELKYRVYTSITFEITPPENDEPRLRYEVEETSPGSITDPEHDGRYGSWIGGSTEASPTGEVGFGVIDDTLEVSLHAGGTLIYRAAAIGKIGDNYYLYYAPP